MNINPNLPPTNLYCGSLSDCGPQPPIPHLTLTRLILYRSRNCAFSLFCQQGSWLVAGSVQSSPAGLEQYHHHPSRDQATLLSIYITYLMLSTWPKADVMMWWWRQLWALMELSGGDLALNTAPVGMPATADKALLLFWLDVLRSDISNAGLVMAQGYQNMHCDYILNTIISWSPPRSRSFDLVLELEQDVKDALCSSPSWISSW